MLAVDLKSQCFFGQCVFMSGHKNDNLWPIKNSSTYKIYLDKFIEACIGNCSPPPPKPKHTESSTSQHWVFHLPPKIQSGCVTKLRFCKSRLSGTLFLLPISICVYTCVSVWWLYYTKPGLALFACFGGRHVGRWETAVLHLRWTTVLCW